MKYRTIKMSLNLTQSKLTRAEWNNIEVPVSDGEKEILQLIIDGYSDINIKRNKNVSMFSFTKIERTDENEQYLYDKYFAPIIAKTMEKYKPDFIFTPFGSASVSGGGPLKKIKSIDALRFQNLESNIERSRENIFEFLLLDFCNMMCRHLKKDATIYSYYLYTLIQLKKSSIDHINRFVVSFVDTCIAYGNSKTEIRDIVANAYEFIERNPYLISNSDMELYRHQKELFATLDAYKVGENRQPANLILYISPTGTGKTLSPLGIAQGRRVIFVCGARHIGLALAKSAISMEVKIAIAFGCETASDIRLHYFAAVDFTRDRKSGAIRKVDNSNGSKVELIICDLKSYLTAMHYMLAFNPAEKIVTYWDEPTISMDRQEDPLHDLIHKNWTQNMIPHVVLSCATLPKEEEIMETICDFRCRFPGANIRTISSYDCKKSISILTKDGDYGVPHLLFQEYERLQECVEYCMENKTLLRYFDLSEVVRFITYVTNLPQHLTTFPPRSHIENHFDCIADITMNTLKIYYLELLRAVPQSEWDDIYKYMTKTREAKFTRPSNFVNGNGDSVKVAPIASVKITTEDAYTLTDGPTIFLTEDVAKIGSFYIQQSNIPESVFQRIMATISQNNRVSDKIERLEKDLEDYESKRSGGGGGGNDGEKTEGGGGKKSDKKINMDKIPGDIRKLYKEVEDLRGMLQYVALDSIYIPNSRPHLKRWTQQQQQTSKMEDSTASDAFMPMLDETYVKDIMGLQIDNSLKVLLLLGIGLFTDSPNARYMEIMKDLANTQRLFLIIADTDYIYGTNYQFCHGFLSRDLTNMTQQKIIQSMGRIGRGQIQQTYTVRFRDDDMIMGLFKKPTENLEAVNMSRLFCGSEE